jgi:hypothetical protein
MIGYKVEVETSLGDWGRNGEVWPDWDSADKAGMNLLMRWTGARDYRVVGVEEKPNRPSWEEWIAQRGLPPERVQL